MRLPVLVPVIALLMLASIVAIAERGSPRAMSRAPSTTIAAPAAPDAPSAPKVIADLAAPTAVSAAEARAMMVTSAIISLAAQVQMKSHPEALRLAFQSYFNFRAAHPEQVRKPYLYFVDYGLDNRTPRGYVFDMETLRLVDGPFMVAHGRGSSGGSDGPHPLHEYAGQRIDLLGLFLAQETYGFVGHAGGSTYRSIGLRLKGVSGRFNSAARTRGVVVHGAPYVTPDRAGRSEGCPAMEPYRAETLIPEIANGGMVFLFSPLDSKWMEEEPWAGDAIGQLAGAPL